MNKATNDSGGRWLRLVGVAVCIATLLIGGFVFWQYRQRATNRLTLAEALWVTDRDFSRYYGPGTPESRLVVDALVRQSPPLSGPSFDSFVLWRRGIAFTDAPSHEPLLIFGFDPAAIPPERKKLAQ